MILYLIYLKYDFVLYILTLFQVLKGDIRPAIETHEILYQVMQKHNFLPEVS